MVCFVLASPSAQKACDQLTDSQEVGVATAEAREFRFDHAGNRLGQLPVILKNQIDNFDQCSSADVMSSAELNSFTTNMFDCAQIPRSFDIDSGATAVVHKNTQLTITSIHESVFAVSIVVLAYLRFASAMIRLHTGNTDIREQQQYPAL